MSDLEALLAENAELKRWIIEASSAFRNDGGTDTLDEAVGLVRLCHAGAEALAEVAASVIAAWLEEILRDGYTVTVSLYEGEYFAEAGGFYHGSGATLDAALLALVRWLPAGAAAEGGDEH